MDEDDIKTFDDLKVFYICEGIKAKLKQHDKVIGDREKEVKIAENKCAKLREEKQKYYNKFEWLIEYMDDILSIIKLDDGEYYFISEKDYNYDGFNSILFEDESDWDDLYKLLHEVLIKEKMVYIPCNMIEHYTCKHHVDKYEVQDGVYEIECEKVSYIDDDEKRKICKYVNIADDGDHCLDDLDHCFMKLGDCDRDAPDDKEPNWKINIRGDAEGCYVYPDYTNENIILFYKPQECVDTDDDDTDDDA